VEWVKDSTMRMELAKLADDVVKPGEMVKERENSAV
jgi:hypothetical protein